MSRDFRKVESHDEPEIVGARWWRDGQTDGGTLIDRRSALLALAGLSAAGAGMSMGGLTGCGGGPTESAPADISADALDAQRKYGWDFGSEGKTLDFGEGAGEPVPPEVLDGLVDALRPKNPVHVPHYGSVLFQSLTATPTTPSSAPHVALRSVIRPIDTPAMQEALGRGRGLSTLFDGAPAGRAIVVDLPGPEAVAFAAGLANRFDPVFWFDNWPHPRGLVPSHLTLAATLHHLKTFEALAAARSATAAPVFVLDSNRLLPFDDASDRFDNRYVAQLPTAQQLQALGVTQLLYVRPTGSDRELDDLNARFVEYRAGQIDVKLVAADAFVAPPEEAEAKEEPAVASTTDSHYGTTHHYSSHHHYGGVGSHWFFWNHYGWGSPRVNAVRPTNYADPPAYVPARRAVAYGSTARPAGFGEVNVRTGSGGKPSLSPTQSKAAAISRTTRSSSGTTRGGSYGRTSGGRSGS